MRVGIFLPNWIGDVVMATPAIRAIYEQLPHAQLIAIYRPYIHGLLTGLDWFDHEVLIDPKMDLFQVYDRLRRLQLDVALLFPNSIRTAFYAYLSGAKRRIGYARFVRSWFLTDCIKSHRDRFGRFVPSSVLLAYNQLAATLGVKANLQMTLKVTPTELHQAKEVFTRIHLCEERPIWCINPGAAYGSAKLWPIDSFAKLARDCVNEFNVQILILCGPGQEHIAKKIVNLACHPSVVSLADNPLSIGLIKACLSRSKLLITTDSGPRHIATALGLPVITLFGPTHVQWTNTFAPTELHLQIKVPCGPCQLRTCPLDHACMRLLHSQTVLQAIQQYIQRIL